MTVFGGVEAIHPAKASGSRGLGGGGSSTLTEVEADCAEAHAPMAAKAAEQIRMTNQRCKSGLQESDYSKSFEFLRATHAQISSFL
jgi:hypothetical protein